MTMATELTMEMKASPLAKAEFTFVSEPGASANNENANGNGTANGGGGHVSCVNCQTVETPLWRRTPDRNPICNLNACATGLSHATADDRERLAARPPLGSRSHSANGIVNAGRIVKEKLRGSSVHQDGPYDVVRSRSSPEAPYRAAEATPSAGSGDLNVGASAGTWRVRCECGVLQRVEVGLVGKATSGDSRAQLRGYYICRTPRQSPPSRRMRATQTSPAGSLAGEEARMSAALQACLTTHSKTRSDAVVNILRAHPKWEVSAPRPRWASGATACSGRVGAAVIPAADEDGKGGALVGGDGGG
ncbi:hypothetical protein B0H13DRAFT_2281856 [Mycena leptocephala]|nr:hypothetical protein B0H13DRAFT_2281856 [Mycena leptocephala]